MIDRGPPVIGQTDRVIRRVVPLLALASLLALPGCFTESPAALADTQGVLVGWTCEHGDCEVEPRTATVDPPACGERDQWVVGAGAIAILCAATESDGGELTVHEATCRPLACDDELDCPQWEDLVYGCDGGVCTTDRFDLDVLDVRAACLRGVPRAPTCALQDEDPATIDRSALATNACPGEGPCELPEACLE
ncbi:hypothetical protein [Sandaracinus amylolyticus]|uniref:hypothetical protein n=1 Tax=Sandaracinus amylolyticus TaxID=927083 RepID=UPI001F2015D7|nr:hypothetical protein [Sandaracinus amylolyticus]UJR79520.1 Hypothetical protein I5071_15560 [Sandaracinus amylolyticus]